MDYINISETDDLEKILKEAKSYRPHIANRNNKLMLLFTLKD